jgi:hypothetical protein
MNSGDIMTMTVSPSIPPQHSEAAVALAERYKLLTDAALRELRRDLFPDIATARRILQNLVRQGLLSETPLYRNRSCYVAANTAEEKPDISENAKIRAYAMLAVCAKQTAQRTRLTRGEFQQYFPDTYRTGLPMNYYIDLTADQPMLGYLRVDLGGAARWDRIAVKAQSDVRKHRLEPAFARFVKRKALEIRIVTALPQKADRLRRALVEKAIPDGISIHVSVIPELINLIAPLPS